MTRRTTQYLTFGLDHHLCAIPATAVKEINHIYKMTLNSTQPTAEEFSLRGKVVPIIQFRHLLGLKHRDGDDDSRVIIIDCPHSLLAIQVDSIQSVIDLPALSFPDLIPGQEPVFFERILIQGYTLLLINILHCLNPEFTGVDTAFSGVIDPVENKMKLA